MATDQARYKAMSKWPRANLQIRGGIVSGTVNGKRCEEMPLGEFVDAAMLSHQSAGANPSRSVAAGSSRTATVAGSGGSTRGGSRSGGSGRKSGTARTAGRPRKALAGTT